MPLIRVTSALPPPFWVFFLVARQENGHNIQCRDLVHACSSPAPAEILDSNSKHPLLAKILRVLHYASPFLARTAGWPLHPTPREPPPVHRTTLLPLR